MVSNMQARRWLRRSAHAGVGLALAVTLGVNGSAGGTVQAAADAGVRAKACAPSGATAGASAARVARGSSNGQDPNSVTAATAGRMESALQSRVNAMVAAGTLRGDRTRTHNDVITVRTYVHVIEKSDGSGGITSDQLHAQMRVLNDAYAGRTAPNAAATPFRFRIAAVDITKKTAWYNWDLNEDGTETAAALAAKRALHRGGWADLNVYIAGLGSGLLGYATFPQDGVLKLDGLVVLNDSLPGGSAAPYNEGDTATHEIGHWLGLFHTFENGCKPPGDYVKDTPYQADGDNIFYCGENPDFGDDTCPQPGKDPVHNFMSYGDDPCLNRFTKGQADREVWTWLSYRQGR
jgi:hypothetical protein